MHEHLDLAIPALGNFGRDSPSWPRKTENIAYCSFECNSKHAHNKEIGSGAEARSSSQLNHGGAGGTPATAAPASVEQQLEVGSRPGGASFLGPPGWQPRGIELFWGSFVAAFSYKDCFGGSENNRIYSGLADITD